MKKYLVALLLSYLLVLCGAGTYVVATSPDYYGTITITNNSTSTATNVVVPVTINSTSMISVGYLNANANYTAMLNTSGANVPYMPGYPSTWMMFVPSIGAKSNLNYVLNTDTATLGATQYYFPGAAGMNTTDTGPWFGGSDNFTIQTSGFIDTANGTNKHILRKDNAIEIYVSPTVSQNITAEIWANSANTSPTSYTDTYATWSSEANTYDNNPGTNATHNVVNDGVWTNPLDLNLTATVDIISVGVFPSGFGAGGEKVAVWLYYSSAWHQSYNGTYTDAAWKTISGYVEGVSKVRVFGQNNSGAPSQWFLHEVNVTTPTRVSATGVASGEKTVTVQADGTLFGISANQTPSSGWPITDNLTLNLPLYHTALNGATFASVDKNALTATATEATWSASTGRTFDGINDTISLPNDAILDVTSVSTFAWVKLLATKAPGAYGTIIGQTASYAYYIYQDGGAGYSANINQGGNVGKPIGVEDLNVWHFVGFTYTSGAYYTYYDAVQSAVKATVGDLIADNTFRIGGSAGRFTNCVIGDSFVYSRAISAAEVTNLRNATKWKYDGSNNFFDYVVVGAGVPSNTNDIVSFQNNVMPYVEYQEIWVNGVQQQYVDWEYGTVFQDSSAGNHDATPTFRTTSSNVDVTASLVSFAPVTEAKAPAYAVTAASPFLSSNITSSSGFTSNTSGATYPGAGVITDIATAGETPVPFLTLILGGIFTLALSLVTTHFLREHNVTSLIIKAAIIACCMGIFVAVKAMDGWLIMIFIMIAIGIAMASGTRSLVGTGVTGNNLFGFLTMSFVGMTLINRMLEGRMLQTTDIDIINRVSVFTPFAVGGWFTLPVPNVGFLTSGLPALVRWDYSFFGGNVQLIQYLLYSVSATVLFILFLAAIGAAYNIFSRSR